MKKEAIFKMAAVLLTVALVSGLAYAVTIRGGDSRYGSGQGMMGGQYGRQMPMRHQQMMGGQYGRQMPMHRQQMMGRPRPGMRPSHMMQVSGEILGVKTVNVRSAEKQHEMVRMKTDRGNIVMVDLGPKTQKLGRLNLAKGQQITVTGRGGIAKGAKLLLADTIQAGGKTLKVRTPQMTRVQGEIVGSEKARVRKTGTTNQLVILQTSHGKIPVDLGPMANLKNVDIQNGTPMKAEGKMVRVQGKPFFMARMFKTGQGKPQAVQRPSIKPKK